MEITSVGGRETGTKKEREREREGNKTDIRANIWILPMDLISAL